jgi:hypothetical protein
MTRIAPAARWPRLLPLVLVAIPAVAGAEPPADQGIPVDAVPAYAVAPAVYGGPPSYAAAAPGVTPLAVAGDDVDRAIGIARRVRDDRVAERSFLAPTALVAPDGTATFTAQAPIAPGAALRLDRSFGDRLSLGVGVVGILDEDDLYGIGSLHGKYQLARGARAALAVTASVYNLPADASDDMDTQNLFIPGVVASMCTTDDCRTLISVDVQALAGVSDESLPIVGGVSVASGVRRQLIAELHTTTADDDRVYFGFIGGRFLGRSLAFDAGLGFGIVSQSSRTAQCIDFCGDDDLYIDTTPELGAYPFLAISSRL